MTDADMHDCRATDRRGQERPTRGSTHALQQRDDVAILVSVFGPERINFCAIRLWLRAVHLRAHFKTRKRNPKRKQPFA